MFAERTQIDSVVATIWREVLGAAQVEAGDNFLDLGGNSLRAGEIAWRVREEVGVDLPIDVVLDTNTLADYVTAVTAALASRPAPPQS